MRKLFNRRAVIVPAVACFLTLVGWAIWPTPYRYTTIRLGGYSLTVRFNRLTGHAERFRNGEWEGWPRFPRTQTQANQPPASGTVLVDPSEIDPLPPKTRTLLRSRKCFPGWLRGVWGIQ